MKEREALVKALLSKTIAYKKVYSDIMGSVQGGVWLSQVVYWGQRATRDDGYFYKSKTEWEKETGLTERQTRRIELIAIDLKVVDSMIDMAEGRETRHYKLNIDGLVEQFVKLPPTIGGGFPNETSVVSSTENTENIEEYFNNRPEHLVNKGETKKKGTSKKEIATAVKKGLHLAATIHSDFEKYLGLTPTWTTKTNQQYYQFFRERYVAGQTAEAFATWWRSDDFRAKQNISLFKVKEQWHQAFMKRTKTDEYDAVSERKKAEAKRAANTQ